MDSLAVYWKTSSREKREVRLNKFTLFIYFKSVDSFEFEYFAIKFLNNLKKRGTFK